jgi:F420-non-reducing hydrogenase iron-sulfur subunit
MLIYVAKYKGKRKPIAVINQNLRTIRKVVQTMFGSMGKEKKEGNVAELQVTVFHCITALENAEYLNFKNIDIQSVKLPCSIMSREIVFLKAFESGADAVIVLVCPEGSCRYLQGNLRAAKRVASVKKILDEIGLDGRRLNLFNIPRGDQTAVSRIMEQTIYDLGSLGPNPAKSGTKGRTSNS